MLKSRETYEIMRAEDVGWGANKLVLGKHSGRNAFRSRLQELGIMLHSEEALNAAFARFKELADKKHEIFDEDLQALVSDEMVTLEHEHYKLVSLRVCSETGETPQARIAITEDGRERNATAREGPVDTRSRRLRRLSARCGLQLFSVNAITSGSDVQASHRAAAQGRAHCEWPGRIPIS